MQSCWPRSAGWSGAPRLAKYAGEAYSSRTALPRRRAISDGSLISPSRILTSTFLVREIGRPRRQFRIDGDFRIVARKLVDDRRDGDKAKFDRHGNAQMSGRPLGGFLQNLVCNVGLLHDALAPFEIAPARLGQSEAAGGAFEQPYPNALFQHRDTTRQRGDGYPRSFACAGETAGTRDLDEQGHVLQRHDRRGSHRQWSTHSLINGIIILILPHLSVFQKT